MWKIWKARNSKSFNGEVVGPKDIVNKDLFYFHEYESNLIPPSPPRVIHSCNDDRNLTVAQDGIVMFVDASVHKEKKTASIDVAATDSYGNLLHAFGTPIQYVGKVITAEAIAIRMAMENAREKGWSKVQISSDAKKKCGGYGTTMNYSLMGDRDYL
uniref:RNase H type-1 domain-containing protein n=1 Tax=Solanum lycopersicum TaxID=4081 RepID=A0A3Q7HP54_SOLLC